MSNYGAAKCSLDVSTTDFRVYEASLLKLGKSVEDPCLAIPFRRLLLVVHNRYGVQYLMEVVVFAVGGTVPMMTKPCSEPDFLGLEIFLFEKPSS